VQEELASGQTQHTCEVYTYPDAGLESEEKGLSPAQILENPPQKQKKNPKKSKRRDKQKEREAGGVLWERGTHLVVQGC